MTKLETEAYYSAIGRKNDLISVNSTDTEESICQEIRRKLEQNMESIAIEIFHEDNNILSLALICAGTGTLDLYQDRQCVLFGEAPETIAAHIVRLIPKSAKSPYDWYLEKILPDGNYKLRSLSSNQTKTLHPKTDTPSGVLGIYTDRDGNSICHPVTPPNPDRVMILTKYLKYIKDPMTRSFARTCINLLPPYVLSVPASASSGKRPASNIAPGGLLRHLTDTAEMLIQLTSQDYAHIEYTAHEIDMMLVAAMFHDFLHRGWQEDYEKDPSMKFDHPRLAADALRCVTGIIPDNDLAFIANCIESHMGQNNTDKNNPSERPLPIPDTKCKYLVHLANHLVTRSKIAIVRDNSLFAYEDQNVITIIRKTAITNTELAYIQNARNRSIDMEAAKELGIADTEEEIKQHWSDILKTCTSQEADARYVELAYRTTFF